MGWAALCSIALSLIACSEPDPEWEETSFETCDGTEVTVRVDPGLISVGPEQNTIRRFGDTAWITVSADNTVASFDGGSVTTASDLGQGRNPYDSWADDREVWITNYLTNSVSVFDIESGTTRELTDDRFDSPTAVLGNETTVFVTNVAFRGTGLFESGSVLAIDRTTFEVVADFETATTNPQFLAWANDGKTLVVVNSGPFDFRTEGAFATDDASIELWSLDDLGDIAERTAFPLPLGSNERNGSPGEVIQVGSTLYLTSGTGPVLFAFDLETLEWTRDSSNPIALYEASGDAVNRATLYKDLIWNSAFNEDKIVVFDPTCEKSVGVIPIDRSDLLAGPFGTVFFRDKVDFGYTILSNANSLRRFEVVFDNRN